MQKQRTNRIDDISCVSPAGAFSRGWQVERVTGTEGGNPMFLHQPDSQMYFATVMRILHYSGMASLKSDKGIPKAVVSALG